MIKVDVPLKDIQPIANILLATVELLLEIETNNYLNSCNENIRDKEQFTNLAKVITEANNWGVKSETS